MTTLAERQLQAARNLAAHIATRLEADLSLQLWNGEMLPLGPGARSDILIVIASPDALRRILLRPGLMTVFELYASGDVDIAGGSLPEAVARWDHIKALRLPKTVDKLFIARTVWPFLFAAQNADAISQHGWNKPVEGRVEKGRDDKSLIGFHYDVSNAFYALFLDPEMVYSCAYYAREDMDLAQAQIEKLDRICRKLRLQTGERFLDIGCGWGGLICHAAKNYGVKAHGVTLSQEQFEYCQAKIAREGLGDLVKVELRDYRTLATPESYDKIAQIEMFEHVGIDNHDAHFIQMHRLLRSRWFYLHQASTRMATRDLKNFRKPTQYQKVITRFIFPGGEFDYIGLSTTNLERLGFEVHDVEAMREHYIPTLRAWGARLHANREKAIAEAGPQRYRLWEMYFTLFAFAFERNTVSVFQTLASKRRRGPSGLPLARDYTS